MPRQKILRYHLWIIQIIQPLMVSAVGGMAAFGGGNNIFEGRSPHGLRPRNPLFSVVAPLPELTASK
jgi:hypothetical protein